MPRYRLLKLLVVFCLTSAASGCGVVPVRFGSAYYGPQDEGSPQGDKATQDLTATMDNMDRVYHDLMARLTLKQQLVLSHEQTVWLNTRDRGCIRTGADNNRCKLIMTQTRTAVLARRSRALSTLPPPASGVTDSSTPVGAPNTVEAPPAVVQRSKTVNVAATAMPWIWKTGGINAPFKFGYPDGTPPTSVQLAELGVRPGEHLTIRYVSGSVTLGPGTPATDALGYADLHDQSETGPAGKYPSAYMQPDAANVGALVGVFTKADGSIVGRPFGVGDGPKTVPIPPGAERLQLGINDDIYGAENSGSGNSGVLIVNVSVD